MPGGGAPWVTLDSLWGVLESYWEYLERTGGKLEKNGENYQLSKHLNFFREGWGGVSLTKDQFVTALSIMLTVFPRPVAPRVRAAPPARRLRIGLCVDAPCVITPSNVDTKSHGYRRENIESTVNSL